MKPPELESWRVAEVVERCTRNGVTSWTSVARQLGCSVDRARLLGDPGYFEVRPWPLAEPAGDADDADAELLTAILGA